MIFLGRGPEIIFLNIVGNDTVTTKTDLDDSTIESSEEVTTISSSLAGLMTSPIETTTSSLIPIYFTTEEPKFPRLPPSPSESTFSPTTTPSTTEGIKITTIANDRQATMRMLRDPTTPAPSTTSKRTTISDFVTPKIITKDIPPVLSNEMIVIAVPAICFIVICSIILLTATV